MRKLSMYLFNSIVSLTFIKESCPSIKYINTEKNNNKINKQVYVNSKLKKHKLTEGDLYFVKNPYESNLELVKLKVLPENWYLSDNNVHYRVPKGNIWVERVGKNDVITSDINNENNWGPVSSNYCIISLFTLLQFLYLTIRFLSLCFIPK